MWTKINEAEDIVSYRRTEGKITVIIEARLQDRGWKIYKTYQVNGSNKLVKEYSATSRTHALSIIENLKKENDLNERRIDSLSSVKLSLRREYKEYDVEKWCFRVNNVNIINLAIIRYAEEITVDIVLNEMFRGAEKSITRKLYSTLNLKDLGNQVKQNIYFFRDEKHSKKGAKKGVVIGKIEMDLSEEPSEQPLE